MPKVIDITLATGETKAQFNADLRSLLGQDYQPFGSVCVANSSDLYFAQTMVRYAPEPEPKVPPGVDTSEPPQGPDTASGWGDDEPEHPSPHGGPVAAPAPGVKLVKKAIAPK